jgi:outer membrane protein TolC
MFNFTFSKISSKSLLIASLFAFAFAPAPSKAEDTLPSVWNDFDPVNAEKYNSGNTNQRELPSKKNVIIETEQVPVAPKVISQPIKAKRVAPIPTQNIVEQSTIKTGNSPDPFKMIDELNDPNAPPPKTDFLNGSDDPEGSNLEKALPLDIPLSERQADILDPIELDINTANLLDLNIEKALLISLQSNLPQRIIDETVIRDKWRFWNTGSSLLPDGFLGYNVVNRKGGSSFSSTTGTPINVGTNYIAQIGARYTLGPSQLFSTIAAYYDWMANSKFSGANLQDLMRQTVNQYYEVMRARGELAARIEAVRQSNIQVALNEKLDQAGVGTKFAVLQAKTQLAENELALLAQQSATRISEVQLLTILNLPLETDIRLEESQISKRTLVSPEYSIDELVDSAMSHRPDITRRRFSYKASKQRVNQAIAGFAPSFSASYTLNSFATNFGRSLEPRNLDQFKTGSLGMDWPILKGIGLYQISDINQKRAESRQAGLELENEKLQINGQVRDAFLRSGASEKQIDAAERQLEAATEGIRLARIRLQNGVGTNIDLIDTQRNYVNALVGKVRAVVQYNQAQVDLLKAIGLISVESILNGDYSVKAMDEVADDVEEDDFQQAGYSAI